MDEFQQALEEEMAALHKDVYNYYQREFDQRFEELVNSRSLGELMGTLAPIDKLTIVKATAQDIASELIVQRDRLISLGFAPEDPLCSELNYMKLKLTEIAKDAMERLKFIKEQGQTF